MKQKCLVLLALVLVLVSWSSSSVFALNTEASVDSNSQGLTTVSLPDAMRLAMQQNTQSLLAEERTREAQGIKEQKTSGLLPHLSAGVSQYSETLNLAALGFTPASFPGITNPKLGPFGVFDARITLMQNLFDLTALSEYQAGKAQLRKAQLQESFARQRAGLESGVLYLELLRVQASSRGNKSDVDAAQKFLVLFRDQHKSGLATGIDLARAETQLSQSKSVLIQSQTLENDTALRLKRSMGVALESSLKLSDKLSPTLQGEMPMDQILAEAQEKRLEIQVANEEIHRTKAEQKAALGRQLPSLAAEADVGGSGNRPDQNLDDTYHFGVALNLPVFDGGATLGRIKQARSETRQAQILYDDIKTQVEQDVRTAFQNLLQTKTQVMTAKQTYELAGRELMLVQDQFRSGVGDSLALVNAENSLTRAREDYLSALAGYHISRLFLAYSIGEMEGFKL